jgi:ABC-2 type transport system ATP-binding protein
VVIEIENLSKEYGAVRALKGVSLCIEGGVMGRLGPNGAGKTTLVEIIAGLRSPSSGRISVLGMDPTRRSEALRERIGVQLQSTALPQELTPLETLRMFGSFYRKALPPKEVLERMGLSDKAKSRNSTLSGGQQQRLAIGMAIVHDPDLILLDEPTSGLDPIARRDIHARITDLRSGGRTVLLTTHYVEETETLCDRVLFLREGSVAAEGRPGELVAQARGNSTIWLAIDGDLDPTLLLHAGAVAQGREGEYFRFLTPDPTAAILALGETLKSHQGTLLDVRMKRPNLEDVYLDIMGDVAAASQEKL